MQRLQCKVNYSMHQQFYYHKKFSDNSLNTTRLFSKFKIIATLTLEPDAKDNTILEWP